MGLRERKKLATRKTLQRETVRLVVEHGLDHVTIEDVATAADVSERTFFNYFSSKEEALVGDGPPRPLDEARETFIGGGPTGELTEDLKRLLISPLEDEADIGPFFEDLRLHIQLIELEPQLLPKFKAAFAAGEQEIAETLAERLGDDAGDIRPQILAEVGLTAMRFSIRRFGGPPPEEPVSVQQLHTTFDHAFAVLRSTFGPQH